MTREEYEKAKCEALKRRSTKFTSSKGTFTIKPPKNESSEKAIKNQK